jgi:hypothetical protein
VVGLWNGSHAFRVSKVATWCFSPVQPCVRSSIESPGILSRRKGAAPARLRLISETGLGSGRRR